MSYLGKNKKLQKGEGWYPDEILFLQKNFYSMTNAKLTEHINCYRNTEGQITVSAVRHKCYEMGLKRGIQIRWSADDTDKLIAWYGIMGDVQIAEYLNEVGNSGRVFTKKNVEKKAKLLKLKRTKGM